MALRLCESSPDVRGFAEEQGEAYAHGAGRADLTRKGYRGRLASWIGVCTSKKVPELGIHGRRGEWDAIVAAFGSSGACHGGRRTPRMTRRGATRRERGLWWARGRSVNGASTARQRHIKGFVWELVWELIGHSSTASL